MNSKKLSLILFPIALIAVIVGVLLLAPRGGGETPQEEGAEVVDVPGLTEEAGSEETPSADVSAAEEGSEPSSEEPAAEELPEPEEPEPEPEEPAREPDPVIPIGIYTTNSADGCRYLTETFTDNFEYRGEEDRSLSDIKTFNFFLSTDASVAGTSFGAEYRATMKSFFDLYPEFGSTYKVGYLMTYVKTDGTQMVRLVTKPEDVQNWREYVEVYLYDAYHQTGWYSHLEPADMKDDTIITQLKFTAGKQCDELSEIILTAFLYDNAEEDLDYETMNFTADNQFTLHIVNQ